MSTDSSFDQALSLVTEFSFSDKLRFNSELASLLKKEGKTGAVGKAVKKAKSKDSEGKPKRKAAPGTLAWMAFVKHCKATMAERFTETTKETERLSICKAIRAEDSASYETFINDFKANYSPAEEEVAEAPAAPAPAAKAPAAKAPAAAKASASATSVASATPKKVAPKKTAETPATPPKTEAKVPSAPKKAPKKVAKVEAKTEPVMPQMEIDGENYFHDRSNNGLWKVEEDNAFGAWVGYYQPENAEEPIRYTESMD